MAHQNDSETPQPVAEEKSLVGVATHDLFSCLIWEAWDRSGGNDDIEGMICLLIVDWQAYAPELNAMKKSLKIGRLLGGEWMEPSDDYESWEGPIKCVTHFARL